MSEPIKVMITEDDPLTRDSYRELIDSQSDMRVVGEVSSGLEAYQRVPILRPNVLLMDLHMPSMDGVEATRRILARVPDCRVLVVTIFDHPQDVEAAVLAGAAGFIVKNGPIRDFLHAIRLVHSGKGVLSPEVTGGVIDLVRGANQDPFVREVEAGLGAPTKITRRESDILQLIAMGRSNTEIAAELYLAPTSVKTYVSRLRTKLKARTRAELVTLYYVSSRISEESLSTERRVPVFGDRARRRNRVPVDRRSDGQRR